MIRYHWAHLLLLRIKTIILPPILIGALRIYRRLLSNRHKSLILPLSWHWHCLRELFVCLSPVLDWWLCTRQILLRLRWKVLIKVLSKGWIWLPSSILTVTSKGVIIGNSIGITVTVNIAIGVRP